MELALLIVGVVGAVLTLAALFISFMKGEIVFSKAFPFLMSSQASTTKEIQRATTQRSHQSIAVLPLENLGKPEDEFFAAGVTEEITSRLAMVAGVSVISRTSATHYARTDKTIVQIGRELGVDYVLEGSVRWSHTAEGQGRVRITPQLIRVSDDTHVWVETYDRVLDDIFVIQSEIAYKVVERLGFSLLEQECKEITAQPTDNLEAYHAYLRARYYATRPHFALSNWEKVIEYAQEAIELDPDFTLAHVELAKAHAKYYFFWYDHSDARKALALGAVERAMELAPDSPHVQLANAYYYLWVHRDSKRALKELEYAEKRMPFNAEILEAKGAVFELLGRWNEAIDAYKRAFEVSPRDPSLPIEIAFAFWISRRYSEAMAAAEQATVLAPEDAWTYLAKVFIHWCWKGDVKESHTALEAVQTDHSWAPWVWFWQEIMEHHYEAAIERLSLTSDDWIRIKIGAEPKSTLAAFAYGLMGEHDKARAAYESAQTMLEQEVKAHPDDPRYHSSLGIAYAGLGYKNEALREGKRAIELLPISQDAFYGVPYVENMAHIYRILGDDNAALDTLEYLLSIDSWISIPYLQVNPIWGRLCAHPRFQILRRKYAVS